MTLQKILTLSLLSLSLGFTACSSSSPSTQSNEGGGENISQLRQTALNLANQQRKSNGVNSLKLNSELNAIAQDHAALYAASNAPYSKKESRNRRAKARRKGYYIVENVGKVAGQNSQRALSSLMNFWRNSPGNAKRFRNSSWTQTGIGMVKKDGVLYVSQNFAAKD